MSQSYIACGGRYRLTRNEPTPREVELWWSEFVVVFLRLLKEEEKFHKNFPEWKRTREKTITILKETADKLDKKKKEVAAARVAGSTVSIVGGIASATSAASLVVPLLPAVIVPLVVVAPAALVTIGTCTTLGSIVSEEMSKKSKMSVVKSTLERDQQATESIKQYTHRSQELKETLEKFMSINVFMELLKQFKQLYADTFSSNKDQFSDEVHNIVQKLWPYLNNSLILDVSTQYVLSFLITGGYLVRFIRLLKLHQNSHLLVFESIGATVKIAPMLAPIFSTWITASLGTANAQIANEPSVNNSGKSLAKIGATVGVTIDCFSLYRSIRDLCEKSPSECALKIREVVCGLENELAGFTDAFNLLVDPQNSP